MSNSSIKLSRKTIANNKTMKNSVEELLGKVKSVKLNQINNTENNKYTNHNNNNSNSKIDNYSIKESKNLSSTNANKCTCFSSNKKVRRETKIKRFIDLNRNKHYFLNDKETNEIYNENNISNAKSKSLIKLTAMKNKKNANNLKFEFEFDSKIVSKCKSFEKNKSNILEPEVLLKNFQNININNHKLCKLHSRPQQKQSINDTNSINDNLSLLAESLNSSAIKYINDSYFNNNNSNSTPLIKKTSKELRQNYISKLIQTNNWTPTSTTYKNSTNKKQHYFNQIIIFDYDDTLLCTTYLCPNGVFIEDMLLSDEESELLAKIEFSALRLLTLAIDSGADVYLVTNSDKGWIEYSTEKYLPSIYNILSKVNVMSARSLFEVQFPGESKKWKTQTFMKIASAYKNIATNLISIGDSISDLEAAQEMAKKFTECYLKLIKFKEGPSPQELNKQLTLVANQFNFIYKSVKNMTIRVEKK